MAAAIVKELTKFVRFGVFGQVCEYDLVVNWFADSTFVRLGLIYVIKNYETDPLLSTRFVAFGNMQKDTKGELSSGIMSEEVADLWTSPPSLSATRAFFAACALLGLMVQGRDAEGAYLQESLGGKPVWAELPKEAVRFAIKEGIFGPEVENMRRPVCLLKKAVYGLLRSGHDFSRGADRKIESLGYTSLRWFDSEPSQYCRSSLPVPKPTL